jgi:hypothetical protein
MQDDCGNDGPESSYKGSAVMLWNTRKDTTLILETITIGRYKITSRNPYGVVGDFWIEEAGGEGMSVSHGTMQTLIREFYDKEF